MRLIFLSGGAVQSKNLRLSKGSLPSAFTDNYMNGTTILERLKEASRIIYWGDGESQIIWSSENSPAIYWEEAAA